MEERNRKKDPRTYTERVIKNGRHKEEVENTDKYRK